jgi:Protein of unknown function (DUF1501)
MSAFPLALPQLLAAGDAKKPKAKSVILLFMWGGPSHIDTWDPKPNAPADVRGEFKPISTTVPGLQISEHFPRLAKLAKHYSVIRSMNHTDPAHLSPTHHLLTGHLARKLNSDADGPSRHDAPHFGAQVTRLSAKQNGLPSFVTLPWIVSHPAAPGGQAPGQNGGWLGSGYDSFVVAGDPASLNFQPLGLARQADMALEQIDSRRKLFEGLDRHGPSDKSFAALQQAAMKMVTSTQTERAFKIEEESPATRDRYGRHIHGQACLMARRLVEAGTKVVQVNWHNDGHAFWDTHGDNFNGLKNRLMPPADQGASALLEDLLARGMLDETLVVWVGEFGRTPRSVNAGREHWPKCYSAMLAGGGIKPGMVYGSSDRIGAYPANDPVSPADLTATIYQCLGIDPAREITDRFGRPMALTIGQPVTGILA